MNNVNRKMKKVSEWMVEYVDAWSVYEVEGLAKRFKEGTGLELGVGGTDPKELNKTVGQFKGLTAPIKTEKKVISGYVLAEILASRYNEHCTYYQKMGRGFRFRAAIDDIVAVGK